MAYCTLVSITSFDIIVSAPSILLFSDRDMGCTASVEQSPSKKDGSVTKSTTPTAPNEVSENDSFTVVVNRGGSDCCGVKTSGKEVLRTPTPNFAPHVTDLNDSLLCPPSTVLPQSPSESTPTHTPQQNHQISDTWFDTHQGAGTLIPISRSLRQSAEPHEHNKSESFSLPRWSANRDGDGADNDTMTSPRESSTTVSVSFVSHVVVLKDKDASLMNGAPSSLARGDHSPLRSSSSIGDDSLSAGQDVTTSASASVPIVPLSVPHSCQMAVKRIKPRTRIIS